MAYTEPELSGHAVMNPKINAAKTKKAAQHPDRPGEECKAEPGRIQPAVDFTRCEGKNDCVEVCPYDVFEVRRMDDADFAKLGFFQKLKSRVHGRKAAYVPRANLCQACGLCVVACPEQAIKLVDLGRAI